MAALRATARLPVGSTAWVSEERNCALQIAESEVEEFTFSARNDLDWLNEHMAEIFDENQLSVTEIFKTPGKLRGKTPRTVRKRDPAQERAPLSDLFSATPKQAATAFRQQPVDRQVPKFQVAEDPIEPARTQVPSQKPAVAWAANTAFVDSGYHGSQTSVTAEIDERTNLSQPLKQKLEDKTAQMEQSIRTSFVSEGRTTEGSFKSAKEDQTIAVIIEESGENLGTDASKAEQLQLESPVNESAEPILPPKQPTEASVRAQATQLQDELPSKPAELDLFEDVQSPSEGSSPIRAPLVRKSSLTFASLPAREPLTAKQSIGNRTSRTSHLEQSRTSYFGRPTGGKRLGNAEQEDYQDDGDEMHVDLVGRTVEANVQSDSNSKLTRMHNKTSTQRLQDQISMLGQSQSHAPRPSKSIPNMAAIASQSTNILQYQEAHRAGSPLRSHRTFVTPGAFPEDEDDWIEPPNVTAHAPSIFSPRPALTKSVSADVMEGILGKESISRPDFNVPKQRRDDQTRQSPIRDPTIPERTATTLGHVKSASTSVLRSPTKESDVSEALVKKGISVSNPNLASAAQDDESCSPPKSPSRSFRDSPLKAAKDKVSSILKTSRNLFVSSAAASAAAKGTLSPSSTRVGHHDGPSLEDVFQTSSLYPSLDNLQQVQDQSRSDSPSKMFAKGNPAEAENKKREKEAREAQRREEKLEKLREKESEKARVFSQQEQERVAAMEKQILAKKEQERAAKCTEVEVPRATRSSPRKNKAQVEPEVISAAATTLVGSREIEMMDAAVAAPEVSRPTTAAQTASSREPKRPMKPAKEAINAAKQAPVVIRVDTGSQRNPQRNLFHPSNATLSGSLQESLAPASSSQRTTGAQAAIKGKASVPSVRPKASVSSLKGSSSTTGKVRALEAAAKKKDLEEQEAQRKRNNKLEIDRKRAALQEEKQQEQRQHDAEKAREKEREYAASQIDPKKHPQRALEKRMEIERAKQQKPPAPAPRPQLGAELGQSSMQDKPLPPAPSFRGELGHGRPVSRVETAIHRAEDDFGRSVSTLQNMTKAPPKRPLPQDASDESQSRPTLQRNGPSNHAPDPKRRKTIEDHDEDMVDSQPKGHMAPPIRQSSARQKDGPNKSLFPNGYTNAAQPSHGGPLLHKATLNAQQMHRVKPAHPMDMTQTSKATINFAPNPSQGPGPGPGPGPTHKTPARPAGTAVHAGKSTGKPSARSSPRFQNGESIELPEIPTDSEDEDSGDDFPVPGWANSPALRQGLMIQEGVDPVQVFGLPGEIKLEEVFKNADRHSRFRARTSSANWSGSDRLTEDEVKSDLEARDRMRREGGWSYGLTQLSRGL